MEYNINKAYTLITGQSAGDALDEYFINPFDQNGFLINQFNIDVRINEWNGIPIIIYMPEIATLKGQYNLEINVTANYNFEPIPSTGNPFVIGGNNTDYWGTSRTIGFLNNYQIMCWKPISLLDTESGYYSVTPFNDNSAPASPLRALNEEETTSTKTFSDLIGQFKS